MATVQQLLHGLTGGSAEAVRDAAYDVTVRLLETVTKQNNSGGIVDPDDLWRSVSLFISLRTPSRT